MARKPKLVTTLDTANEKQQVIEACKNDFLFFAKHFLFIRSRDGITKFYLNSAQIELHSLLEKQKRDTGKIRAVILKGRQMGISTYIQARFLWRTMFNKGLMAFILSHSEDSTQNLFEITDRYYTYVPDDMKPKLDASNEKVLKFHGMDSGYRVATASTGEVGRSFTINLFHGSEVAFWKNEKNHIAGIFQAVPQADNTEILLESTANGIDNMFYRLYTQAGQNGNAFQAIFLPWYREQSYQSKLPDNFILSQEESNYKRIWELSDEQIMWRRQKIAEFRTDDSLDPEADFGKEYPCTASEAFKVAQNTSLISPEAVLAARKCKDEVPYTDAVIGADIAREGDDKTVFTVRRGRKVTKIVTHKKMDLVQVAGVLTELIIQEKPKKVFIDMGMGAGVYDILRSNGYGNIVVGIYFGGSAFLRQDRYADIRTEMWHTTKQWLDDQPCIIPDRDDLQGDLTCAWVKPDSLNTKKRLASKKEIKAKIHRSPDYADSLALTFAQPVNLIDISKSNLRISSDFGSDSYSASGSNSDSWQGG